MELTPSPACGYSTDRVENTAFDYCCILLRWNCCVCVCSRYLVTGLHNTIQYPEINTIAQLLALDLHSIRAYHQDAPLPRPTLNSHESTCCPLPSNSSILQIVSWCSDGHMEPSPKSQYFSEYVKQ
jgi:hypothetical protein